MQWPDVLANLIDKLLISTSYSALTYGSGLLVQFSNASSSRDIFPMVCSVLFFTFALKFRTLEGLQNVCILMAAQKFSLGVPLPQEPLGVLVLPAVFVYFGTAAIIMEYTCKTGKSMLFKTGEAAKVCGYVVLFVGARALARFEAIKQTEILGVISVVYLLLPFEPTLDDRGAIFHFVQITDCLANRGGVLWLIGKIQTFTGVSSLFPNIFFFLALLMWWNPLVRLPRLQNCAGVFTFYTARKIVMLMQSHMSDAICCSLLACVLVCIMVNMNANSPLLSMVTLGTGILLTSWLDKWVRTWSQNSDWMAIYLLVFLILEILGDRFRPVAAKHDGVLDTVAKQHESNTVYAGIAHEQALLGLPSVADSSGSH